MGHILSLHVKLSVPYVCAFENKNKTKNKKCTCMITFTIL